MPHLCQWNLKIVNKIKIEQSKIKKHDKHDFGLLTKNLQKSLEKLAKSVNSKGALSSDLDRFVRERVPKYTQGLDQEDITNFQHDYYNETYDHNQPFPDLEYHETKQESSLIITKKNRKRGKLTLKSAIPRQKQSKRRQKAVVKEFELLTQPKSTDEDKIRKFNKKIDDEINDRISSAKNIKWNPPKLENIAENQDRNTCSNSSCKRIVSNPASQFTTLSNLRSGAVDSQSLVKLERLTANKKKAENIELVSDNNYELSEASSIYEEEKEQEDPDEDIDLMLIRGEALKKKLKSIEQLKEPDVIYLDSSSDQMLEFEPEPILPSKNSKKVKIKSENIFYEPHFDVPDNYDEIPNTFGTQHNLLKKESSFWIANKNNFDYSIQGQAGTIKIQRPRTIDLKKVSASFLMNIG